MINVISIRQPYTELLVKGLRLHEFRAWSIEPGWYAVHASGKPFVLESGEVYDTGCICGAVYIDGIVNTNSLPYDVLCDDAFIDSPAEIPGLVSQYPLAWHVDESLSINAVDRPRYKGRQRVWQVDETTEPILALLHDEMTRDGAEEAC